MKRYPGIRPFRSDERALFFGRTDDTERLLRLIRLEKIVILYGKSGYGKSSLLQAGVCPLLLDAGELPFRELRLGPYKAGDSMLPALALINAVAIHVQAKETPVITRLAALFPGDGSLWFALKMRQLATGSTRFLFLFDQFEELFTYPAEQILEFKRQLAEALYTLVPDRYGRALAKNPGALTADEQAAFYAPLEFKVVFSIRADRMSQLNTLKDYLPNLLQHAYLLDALDEKQATEAITAPALLPRRVSPFGGGQGGGIGSMLPTEDFDTDPFQYAPAALSLIFQELRDADTGKIETSALQIVCRHVEDNVVGPGGDLPGGDLTTFKKLSNLGADLTISPEDLGDLKSIFREFYDRTITVLPEDQQPVARHLVEDLLIKEGVRLPFAEQALLAEPGVTPGLLQALADASLLRVERDEQGRMLYEVGHDTLVGPISEAAQVRRDEEEKIRLQQDADQQRREKEKAILERRRARVLAIGAFVLAIFALGALGFALYQQKVLRKTTAKVVDSILQDADEAVYQLKYDEAWDKIGDAAKLGEKKEAVARHFMEIAYFNGESRNWEKALSAAQHTAGMFENEDAVDAFNALQPSASNFLPTFRQMLKALDSTQFNLLEQRYFPTMIEVPSGVFQMGSDDEKPIHEVHLTTYHLARTENTFFQFALYAVAIHRDITKFSPSWGLAGDNPAVNVSWFDAILYANWLSNRFGLDTAYVVGEKTEDSFGDQYEVTLRPEARGYRLPSEAEWEYTDKGGPVQQPFKYAGSDSLDLVGWFDDNSAIGGIQRTHVVSAKQANTLGFFDLSGNVREWCGDWHAAYSADTQIDPRGPDKGAYRVFRGGGWGDYAEACRAAYRESYSLPFRLSTLGFRLARSF